MESHPHETGGAGCAGISVALSLFMPAIHVRDVPETVIAALERHANIVATALAHDVGRVCTNCVEDFARFAPLIEVVAPAGTRGATFDRIRWHPRVG